jgi:cell division protein FtsA
VSERDLIVGVDVGTTKVLTLVGALRDHRLQILGYGHAPSTGLRKGVVVDIPETTASIRESLAAAERAASVRIGSALISISGDHLASLNGRGGVPVAPGREVSIEDVRRARRAARQIVHPPDRVILHNIPRHYLTDGQDGVRHPVGMAAGYLEVETHIVTVGSSFLDNLVKSVQRAHLDIEDVVAAPLAAGLAVTTEAEQALGVLAVDAGGGATHVAVFHDGGVVHTAALPVGGSHLTYDLSVGLRLTREAAERLKRASGCARVPDAEPDEYVTIQPAGEEESREIPRRLIPEILEPRVVELAEMVRAEIDRGSQGGVLPASAVVTGGTSLLAGLPATFTETLGIPTRAGLPRHVEGPEEVLQSPAATAAVGLLQFGALRRGGNGLEPGWSASLFQRLGRWLAGIRR